MKLPVFFLGIAFALAGSLYAAEPVLDPPLKPALDAITPDGMLAHIKMLSSDEFEGRAPGSHGEVESVAYITKEFQKVGLAPGNPDGTYTQALSLGGIVSKPTMSLAVKDQPAELKYPGDYVASSARLQDEIKVENSDVVF